MQVYSKKKGKKQPMDRERHSRYKSNLGYPLGAGLRENGGRRLDHQ